MLHRTAASILAMTLRLRARAWLASTAMAVLVGACGHSQIVDPPDGGAGPDDPGPGVDLGSGPPVCAALPAPPTLPPPSGIASGTRLVQRTIAEAAPGGLELPWSVHDALLGVDCAPARLEDGTLRCLPTGSDAHVFDEQFADAARTVPVILMPRAGVLPLGALIVTRSSSPGTSDPFDGLTGCHRSVVAGRWRVASTRTAATYYTRSSGPIIVPASFAVLDLVPELTDFVELAEVRTQLSGSIALRELHGADGSRVFARAFYDAMHDVPVSLQVSAGDRVTRLLPPALTSAQAYFHLPQTCTSSAIDPLFKPVVNVDCDASALRFGSAGKIYEVAPTAGSTHYRCAASASGVGAVASTEPLLGACRESPLSEWTIATPVTSAGVRLTMQTWKIGDAAVLPPVARPLVTFLSRAYTDTALGVDCEVRTAADGVLRCLPRQAGMFFSDAACTSRVAVKVLRDAPDPKYVSDDSRANPPLDEPIKIFQIGAARASGQIYLGTSTGCQPSDTDVSYEIGPEVDPTAFAALALRDAPTAPAP